MVALVKIPKDLFQIIPVDLCNKPETFLKMNPDGKVPVLVDHKEKQTVSDLGEDR